MKSLIPLTFSICLLAACQSANQSSTQPQATSTATSRIKYRLVALQPQKGHSYSDDYPLMLRDFEVQVNQAIAEGWQPFGGVATATMFGVPVQAMVKTE